MSKKISLNTYERLMQLYHLAGFKTCVCFSVFTSPTRGSYFNSISIVLYLLRAPNSCSVSLVSSSSALLLALLVLLSWPLVDRMLKRVLELFLLLLDTE